MDDIGKDVEGYPALWNEEDMDLDIIDKKELML